MIRLDNVSKYYHSDTGVSVGLFKINLEFNKNEFVVITGESGSGKSTLLNVISGCDTYEEGELYINGGATSHFSLEEWEVYKKQNMSFIYQSYRLIDSYTVYENVKTVMMIRDMDNIDEKVYQCLEKVGLKEYAAKKAVHLSSGQKQRLAIARALAKDTDIIIADEPTGNLDVENGKHIMKIFSELAKEKLVIVVTHNYELAEPYATRKVRLYNSEVADDMDIIHKEDGRIIEKAHTYEGWEQENADEGRELQCVNKPKKKDFEKIKKEFNLAGSFVKLNLKNMPKRTVFTMSLFVLMSFAFFTFFGEVLRNVNEMTGGYYSDEAFKNGDKTRIVLKKYDGSVLTEEDVQNVAVLDKVEMVDLQSVANDINYYVDEDDYKIVYDACENPPYDMPDNSYVEALDNTKFMKSDTCITVEDLSAGSIPENIYDVVIYSKDKSLIGKTITVYFKNSNIWPNAQYVGRELTITGILKEETEQLYFSQELCKVLSVNSKALVSSWYPFYIYKGRGVSREVYEVDINKIDISKNPTIRYTNMVLFPYEEIEGNTILMSSNFFDNFIKTETSAGGTLLYYRYKLYKNSVFEYTDADGNKQVTELIITESEGISGTNVMGVSREFFDSVFPDRESRQISVYIEDYAYTDKVLKEIRELGYEAISVYRVGIMDYDLEAVLEKLKTSGIMIVAMFFLFMVGWIVNNMIFQLRKDDYLLLKSLGMEQSVVEKMLVIEIFLGYSLASFAGIATGYIWGLFKNGYMYNIVKYYSLPGMAVVAAVILTLEGAIYISFSKKIKKEKRTL